MAYKIHRQMTMLLFSFIYSLRNHSMEQNRDVARENERKHMVNAENDVEREWIEDNLPEYLLYVALKSFCVFLKQYQKEEANKLLVIYRNSVINTVPTAASEQPLQEMQNNTKQKYLLCLNSLIQDALKRKEDWLWEGNESRGGKERCYYLDSNIWFDKFCEKVKREKLEPISQRKLVAELKERCLLKVQKSSTANVLQRGKKSYHAILADEFTATVSQLNTQSE